MLLFSGIKKYDISINKYFASTDVMQNTNKTQFTILPNYNYILDLPTKIELFLGKYERVWYKNGKIHRDNDPADIVYYESGQIQYEEWYKNGELYRENGPPKICYYENGQIDFEQWYKNGKIHRDNDPADIVYYESGQIKNETWYKNGKIHRDNDPAVIVYYESGQIKLKIWYQNGKTQREIWYKNGQINRKGGFPAVIEYYENSGYDNDSDDEPDQYYENDGYGTDDEYVKIKRNGKIKLKIWYNNNGKIHRDNGPAIIEYNRYEQLISARWYQNGKIKSAKLYQNRQFQSAVWHENGKISINGVEYDENEQNHDEYWIKFKEFEHFKV